MFFFCELQFNQMLGEVFSQNTGMCLVCCSAFVNLIYIYKKIFIFCNTHTYIEHDSHTVKCSKVFTEHLWQTPLH